MKKEYYFFIGTEAELIKIFPVIIECQDLGNICYIIASGQNDLKKSRILNLVKVNGKFIELSYEEDIKKSAVGLFSWFIGTYRRAIDKMKSELDTTSLKGKDMIVHGDTVSTFMGALLGKKLGMRVCHVEAGLRSHHLFNPFPEEIDRLLTSQIARLHFAPGSEPIANLQKAKGEKINTEYNTIIDSLRYSKQIPVLTPQVKELSTENYFVFVMHRQENLANKDLVKRIVSSIQKYAQTKKCVIILHKITENTLSDLNLLDGLKMDKHIVLLPRVDYFDFMKLLNQAQFVITDGGSNQEELHYMGKPCLILRKTTERSEGIGQNALLYDGTVDSIERFVNEYSKYKIESLVDSVSPSKLISDSL